MAPFLLHGDIIATIYETQKFDTFSSVPLYASIYLDEVKIESRRLKEPTNPKLEECFYIRCAHMTSNIIVKLEYDKWLSSVRGRGVIGEAYVEVDEKMLNGVEVDKWVEIVDASKKPISGGPKIHVKLQFFDAKRHQNWSQGIKSPDFPGVPRTFFSQHKGCKVTLYQDAHVLDDFSPRVVLDGGKTYEPQRCWEDIFDAINEAKHFIYITGWSLYTQISLIRDPKRPKHGGDITLGELLKKKAKDDGVRVVLLLWQDGIIRVPGIGSYARTMGTHDKETQSYFKDTNVHCILCPRDSVFYTHHQKIVVVDAKLPNGKDSDHQRRIVSFIGGIDLCNGRYDTQFHSLFQTLAAEHSKDFYQPSISGSAIEKGGPREPWHDIHCKLEGPIAWDVYSTFVQRFRKQGTDQGMLLAEEKLKDFIISPSQATNPDDDDDTWNVQLFRSIDDTAALGFPETAKEAFEHGLVSGENKMIDRSIQDAYINAIRRAKNFIYIENQYFIGSAFGWSVDSTEFDAVHLIPKELSLKIVSKIKAKEKFMVYVVIPMWPEGVPINKTTGAVQKILYLQRRTIEMMYKDIVEALKEEKIEQDPRKYLSFFCLGNREVKKDGEYVPPQRPDQGSDYQKAQEARRFMIYVHSKMMIVDDEYIIVGSANINQRSMDGGRDTEIAMGAYQPHHLATSQGGARGQIHGFRMSLWYEHLGMHEDTFLNPESEECINKVKQLGDKYWELYSNKDSLGSNNLPGHLLRYPVDISADGTLTNLSGFEFFPDTNAPILGDKNPTIINRFLPNNTMDIFINKIFTR